MSNNQVLVVDDDIEIRTIMQELIENLGYPCQCAADGFEALELIKDGEFDVVFCDIRMPEMDGFQVMAEARKVRADIPFIMITGFPKDYAYDQVIEAGAQDFIKKPFTDRELKIKLDRILNECTLAKENRALLDKQILLNEKLSTVLSVAKDLSSELDFDRLLPLIISKVTGVMKAERTSLYIIDWDKNEVWTKVAEKVNEIRMPLGHGISGRVAETGEVINVEDAWELSYFDRSFDLKHHFRTRSVLCVPIINHSGERIAVIQVINKTNQAQFDADDEQLLSALASSAGIAIENAFLVEELEASFEGAIRTLAATVDAKHPLTAGHSQRVTEYSLLIAREMGLESDELEVIKYAGLLHDIGKIGIRDHILLKNGPFTPEERTEMEKHSEKTKTILETFHFPKHLNRVPLMAAYHHEKVNGQGYPYALKGDALPLGSKILAVADVFDALTSPRDYPKYDQDGVMGMKPMPLKKVIDILNADCGTHFDPDVVTAFLGCLPRALRLYRGTHFLPEYVDGFLEPEKVDASAQ